MSKKSVVEWWENNAVDTFKQAVLSEFYGEYLFEKKIDSHYQFQSHETQGAVWLIPDNSPETFIAHRFENFDNHQVLPGVRGFIHCEPIDTSLLSDGRISDVEEKLKSGGKTFATRMNQAFIDVLLETISDSKVYTPDYDLDEFIAEITDGLSAIGFHADRFLFPKHFKRIDCAIREIIVQKL